MTIAIVLLAAGASSRMQGADKMLVPIGDRPLLAAMAERALATGLPVGITLPVPGIERRAALEGLNYTAIDVEDARKGMSASIRCAVQKFSAFSGIMILPADMPGITTQDMQKLLDAAQPHTSDQIVRATDHNGRPGHPVLFAKDHFPALLALSGDQGAKSIIAANQQNITDVALPGDAALLDLDTPEDWDTWQNRDLISRQ